MNKKYLLVFLFVLLSGCTFLGVTKLDRLYGTGSPAVREPASLTSGRIDYWREVKPILDNRCVVCHACYDAPCQLKLTAIEGLERGASKELVYNGARILPAEPTRLFEDAHTVEQWRKMDFFPVLNERQASLAANRDASVLYQLLALKQAHPLPQVAQLGKEFSFALNRENACPKDDTYAEFAEEHPLWGMPYGLPALSASEDATLRHWLEQGARYAPRVDLSELYASEIAQWETFFNRNDLKSQLVSRYLYEHLFLAHLYFAETSAPVFFRLVRSKTPPGEPVQRISTRRPYNNPKVDRVYYRLIPELETTVSKTHMPYILDAARKDRWTKWFFQNDYEVKTLPGYKLKKSANPFITFEQLPLDGRYRFLLDEAHYTIKNFINGPVCRGQVALNVIRDQFWVFFINPNSERDAKFSEFLSQYKKELALPSAEGDIYTPLTTWLKYSTKQKEYLAERDRYLSNYMSDGRKLTLDMLWDGDGHNNNAALTVLRHNDSATVVKGLQGLSPNTAWVIGYPLLERIHYLLVAGYDVYGNVGHQLLSRLHMDFLRMEGESNFLMLLPEPDRGRERKFWYREAGEEVIQFMTYPRLEAQLELGIDYHSNNVKEELYSKIKQHLNAVLLLDNNVSSESDKALRESMLRLMQFKGQQTELLPEMSFIDIVDEQGVSHYYTLVRNNTHLNMTALLVEEKTLIPEENTVTVMKGIVGSYPNAFLQVKRSQLQHFVDSILALEAEADYRKLMDAYGIRRTDQRFWPFSDRIHQQLRQQNPVDFGYLDYNRIENR